MKSKPILVVAGDPKSIFFEIFFKSIKFNKFKNPIIVIASSKLLRSYLRISKYKYKINLLNLDQLKSYKLDNKNINLLDIKYLNTKDYIKDCFNLAFKILRSGLSYKLINGPINKSNFLDKKFLINNTAMLIYNEELSVSPVTTHLPLKLVAKKINQKLIREKIILIDKFYKNHRDFRPKIAVTGLNPHCESILNFNEDEKIIKPAIKLMKKKGYKIYGPFSADTMFLKQNRKKYDIILGMYHDQVLSPIKSIKEYDAINITLGLPFYRISPDHGPNEKMINKNISSPLSLIKALKFLDKR